MQFANVQFANVQFANVQFANVQFANQQINQLINTNYKQILTINKQQQLRLGLKSEVEMTERELVAKFDACFERKLTAFELEDLHKWIHEDGISIEVLHAALRETVVKNVIKWCYFTQILRDWQREGVDSLEKVEQRLQAHEDQKAKRHQQLVASNVPSWSNSDYKEETTPEQEAEFEKLKADMLKRLDDLEKESNNDQDTDGE